MPKQIGRSNAESSQETRRKLLAAGARNFFKSPANVDPLRGLTMREIARLAGVHRNTAYLHWPEGKEAYRGDLVRYLLGDPKIFENDFKEIRDVANSSSDLSLLDALCSVASKDIEMVKDNEVWRAMEVLAVGYMPLITEHHGTAREGYNAVDEELYNLYSVVLDRHGRRPRPPFSSATVGKVIQALVEGAGIRQIFDHGCFLDPVEEGVQHGVFAYAVAAILSVLTTSPGDSRSLYSLLHELLGENDPRLT